MDLRDKVVVVTGASSGIGEATARRLVAEGARLVLAARRTDRIQSLAEALGAALAVTTDMRDPAQVRALVTTATDAYGGVDVLVNNAGQGLHVPVMEIALDDLVAVTELNFYAPLVAMQAVVPIMRTRGGGSIVNVSSGTTLMVPTGTAGYASTKAALNMLSRTARAELAAEGIAVSVVYPFVTATEFHDTLRAGAGPGGRPGLEPHPPELVADAIAQLIISGEESSCLRSCGERRLDHRHRRRGIVMRTVCDAPKRPQLAASALLRFRDGYLEWARLAGADRSPERVATTASGSRWWMFPRLAMAGLLGSRRRRRSRQLLFARGVLLDCLASSARAKALVRRFSAVSHPSW